MDVAAWLGGLGLERYAQAFRDAELTPDVLPELTDADLRELGLPLGPRKAVLKAIRDLAAPPKAAEPSPVATGPERRQLTVMFVDLVGSTALSRRLDPEEMGGLLRAFQDAVAGGIARFDGHVAKFLGDGVLAYFGWPTAHEDAAERAVRAALGLVAAVERLATPDGEALACRVGVATGLVVVGELIGEGSSREEAVVGETPNLAARLQGLAAPGTVVIAEATRRLLGDLFAYRPLAPTRSRASPSPSRPTPSSARAPPRAASRRCTSPASPRWSAASTSWACCSTAGRGPGKAKARSSSSPASPASASRGCCGRCGKGWPPSHTPRSPSSARPTTSTPRSIPWSGSWSGRRGCGGRTRPRPSSTSSRRRWRSRSTRSARRHRRSPTCSASRPGTATRRWS